MCSRCPCCEAVICFDGEFLCNRCDDGTHPAVTVAEHPPYVISCQPVTPEVERMARLLAAPAVVHAIQDAAAPAKVRKEQTMHKPISDEIRAKILASPPTVSNVELATQFGVSDARISVFRRKNGITLKKNAGRPKGSATKKAAKTKRTVATKPDSDEPELRSVQFDVSRKQLDAWWNSLSLDFQAGIFAANFFFDPAGTAR
jgi:hypothetical protein